MITSPLSVSRVVNTFFFGFGVSVALFSVSAFQGWRYFRNNRDSIALQTFVVALLLLNVSEMICSTRLLHNYLVNHFGERDMLIDFDNWVNATFLITVCIFTTVHLFFAQRVFIVCQSHFLHMLLITLTITMLGCGLASGLHPSRRLRFGQGKPDILLDAFHGLSIVSDLIITIALILKVSTWGTEMKGTRNIIRILSVFFLTRGIIISCAQVGHLIMHAVAPESYLFWSSIHLIVSKLYVITTLGMLNLRDHLRRRSDIEEPLRFRTVNSQQSETHAAAIEVGEGISTSNPGRYPSPALSRELPNDSNLSGS